ncbi:toxin subunit [Morganella morganii subsp. morganii]|nr:toxin subunit [Morganella morganii]MBT0338102.1 toxin subunit [Morganella morganii subsp. morganii]
MNNTEQVRIETPSLPKGGGAITGMTGAPGNIGPDGTATFSVPLPVSRGRGYFPEPVLSYNSRNGNDIFGLGWTTSMSAVSRRVVKGVPRYTNEDEFAGPDNEVIVPVLDSNGSPVSSTESKLLGTDLGTKYRVTEYRPRLETTCDRLQYWQTESKVRGEPAEFWVIFAADGQVHLFGYEDQARIYKPDNPQHIARWLINASVSPEGEQIYYRYSNEDNEGCSEDEIRFHPKQSYRYPEKICYGNKKSGRHFPCVNNSADDNQWLFFLVFDYGQRSCRLADIPGWQIPAGQHWLLRQDIFSSYEYGFEIRIRRLCRQVLLFHNVADLAADKDQNCAPELVSRFVLTYDESPVITTLIAVRRSGFNDPTDKNGITVLPPLEFNWTKPEKWSEHQWETLDHIGKLNSHQPYQFLDLWGEGSKGILYKNRGAWWYRAPVRNKNSSDINAVTWSKPQLLPDIPALDKHNLLIDLDGDGRLEWVVIHRGANGYYPQDKDNAEQWLRFSSLSGLPTEFHYPAAQLIDFTGKGLCDLVVIGPKSVRLYPSDRKGWKGGMIIKQPDDVTLPIFGGNERSFTGFSDLPGSGQQHLIRINMDGVYYWPNKGNGYFGHPVYIPGFTPGEHFDPANLYLADIDGNGSADIIYAHSDHLYIYINQSGNRFSEPVKLPLPKGVRYDHTCELQFADIQGNGVDCMILTRPLPELRHWLFEFSTKKPWLLSEINNNMGVNYTLSYRSSAQLWLDEKAASDHQETPVCYLPFPVHCVWKTQTKDEITGNTLTSTVRYRHGAWDGTEREFRGFGYVEITDSLLTESEEGKPETAMPTQTRSWFATGIEPLDKRFPGEYWNEDKAAFPGFAPRFTQNYGDNETECEAESKEAANYWLRRGLKGQLLRQEVYGIDKSELSAVPYEVTEQRIAVRLIETRGSYPVIRPSVIEHRRYLYERFIADPKCTQTVILSSDQYGSPLKEVSISYPRRLLGSVNPYLVLDSLPEETWQHSDDPQQKKLHFVLQQNSYYDLDKPEEDIYQLAIANTQRQDMAESDRDVLPPQGYSLENIPWRNKPPCDECIFIFSGQTRVAYWNDKEESGLFLPDFPVRVAYKENAEFDKEHRDRIENYFPGWNINDLLSSGGYLNTEYAFPEGNENKDENNIYSAQRDIMKYGTQEQFYKPMSYCATNLTKPNELEWDKYFCVVSKYTDSAEGITIPEYNFKYLYPVKITDVNDNISTVTYNGAGQVISIRFSGTEHGKKTGYSDDELIIPDSIEDALNLTTRLPVSELFLYEPNSWMLKVSPEFMTPEYDDVISRLKNGHIITEDGYFSAFSRDRISEENRCLIKAMMIPDKNRLPPHILQLQTDRYDNDNAQQIRQKVTFFDGLSRQLQISVRVEANNTAMKNKKIGHPLKINDSDSRWAVTGRKEYNNKGYIIREYQPYFINDWRYARDYVVQNDQWSDTHYYDPLGRLISVETAKGYFRNSIYTPWFIVQEDENDTE